MIEKIEVSCYKARCEACRRLFINGETFGNLASLRRSLRNAQWLVEKTADDKWKTICPKCQADQKQIDKINAKAKQGGVE